MELGPKRPSPLWFLGRNSIRVVYMDPLGIGVLKREPDAGVVGHQARGNLSGLYVQHRGFRGV